MDTPMQTQYSTLAGQTKDGVNLPVLTIKEIVKSPNLATKFNKTALDALGLEVVNNYNLDRQSRAQWEERNAEGVKLALQVVEKKSFPWTNCSNVKFPLLTIAALQFLARVSILTKGRKLAKLEAIGADQDGKKHAQAGRISDHMSLQLTDEDIDWVDEDEKTKLATSIMGCGFKKTLFDTVSGIQTTEYVPAMNFVVDYYCKNLRTANRVTHLLSMNSNKLQERFRRGLFLKMDDEHQVAATDSTNLLRVAADEVAGVRAPAQAEEYEILEQHLWLDLDDDGYAEPYIVFVRKDTGQVLRVVARFYDHGDVYRVNDPQIRELEQQLHEAKAGAKEAESKAGAGFDPKAGDMGEQSRLEKAIHKLENASDNHVVRIDAVNYFDKYTLIPSPDGGFYGLGLGALLGPMNESVNTLVNQLIDAGTMSNSAGGFLGRGVKIKGGKQSFDPFEWKPVDSTGDDLRKNILPLPVKEPSAVLFQLLGMLVSYSEKISGATDIMTGVSPGQNTPAETSRNTVEQGMMLFSGIYARMYRSFRQELQTRYDNNRLFLRTSPQFWELTKGPNAIIAEDDYTSNRFRIYPMADASSASSSQRKDKAMLLMQVAKELPGFNKYLVVKEFLETHEYENIEQLFPNPQGPNAIPVPPNPKVELEKAKLQQAQQEHQDQMQLGIAKERSVTELNAAKVSELNAKATKELAEAKGVDVGHQIEVLKTQIEAGKAHQEGLFKALDSLQKESSHHLAMDAQEHQQGMDKASAKAKAGAGAGKQAPSGESL